MSQQPLTNDVSRFEKGLTNTVLWIRTHQERFWSITGTAAIVILFLAFVIHHRDTENDEAWTQLGIVQSHLMQNQWDMAQKSLDQWTTRFSGTQAATYAKFMKADLLYKTSDYATATQVYGDLSMTAKPMELRPLALSGKIASEEMSGHPDTAKTDAQDFLTRYPDHYLAGSMYMTQARLTEKTGDVAAAVALYDRFALLYPQSPFTSIAQKRREVLSGIAPASPK